MPVPLKNKDALIAGFSYLLIFLFAAECLFLSVVNPSIWFDDAYSLAVIRHSWKNVLAVTCIDFHPPLYYFILKFFSLLLGENIIVMKLVSTIPSVLTMLAGGYFLKREMGVKAAVVLPLCFIASQTILHYSIEIRMYSWALFFVSVSFLSAYYAVKTDKNSWYAGFTFFMLATFYTHYYAGITVGIGYLFLALFTLVYNKKRILTLVFIFLITTLLYLPWLFVLFGQVENASSGFWIEPFTLIDVCKYVATIFSTGEYITSVLLLLLFLVVLVRVFKKENKTINDHFLLAGLFCVAGLVVFGVVLSICFRPIFISRYIVPVCGLVWLFFAGQIEPFLKNKLFFSLTVFFLLGCGIVANSMSAKDGGAGFAVFKNYLSNEISNDDILVLAAPDYSSQLVGVVSLLFPGHTMAIAETDTYQGGNRTIENANNPFDRKIVSYKDLERVKGVKKWFIVPFESSIDSYKKMISGKSVKFCGNYEWSTYQSGYQFRLYRIE